MVVKFLLLFDNNTESLWSFHDILGDFVFDGDELHDALETFLEEVQIHIFGTSNEEEVDFDAVTFAEPFGDPLGFELEIMLAGADFDLNYLEFAG